MRDMSDKTSLVDWLFMTTSNWFNALEWVASLSPEQKAVHSQVQRTNCDCHQAYVGEITRLMAGCEPYQHSHRSYHHVGNDLQENAHRENVPSGVILSRLSSIPTFWYCDHWSPIGKKHYQVRGTLFYSTGDNAHKDMKNACVGSEATFKFGHPWYWEVPTREQITKVLSLAKQGTIDTLERQYREAHV